MNFDGVLVNILEPDQYYFYKCWSVTDTWVEAHMLRPLNADIKTFFFYIMQKWEVIIQFTVSCTVSAHTF